MVITRKDLVSIISEAINTYYHGTPYNSSADGIMQYGLGGKQPEKLNGGNGEGFESAQGRNYLTKNSGNSLRYALMNDDEPDAHIFQFDNVNTEEDGFGVDEDEVGSLICKYLNGSIKNLPFRKSLLKYFNNEELQGIREGNFRYYASTKKIIDMLAPQEIQAVLSMCNNATTKNIIKPSRHWVVQKPQGKEKEQLSKATSFEPYIDYFEKNKREAY